MLNQQKNGRIAGKTGKKMGKNSTKLQKSFNLC